MVSCELALPDTTRRPSTVPDLRRPYDWSRTDDERAVGLTVYGCEPEEADLFEALCPAFGIVPTMTAEAVSEHSVIPVPGNRCVSVSHKSKVSGQTLRALREAGVEYLSTRSLGVDHIDRDVADSLGITVDNSVYAPDGVADFTVMLILMAVRNAKAVLGAVERQDFRLGGARGKDLRDLTVGVLGVGRIGSAVVRRLQGFGCRVLACSNRPDPAVTVRCVSLEDLFRASDVVTLHVPLDVETHHVVGRQQLAAMRRGSFLINTGRGGLVDTEALTEALERGHLGGAALDVLEGEEGVFYVDCTRGPLEHRLLRRLQHLPNVIITPHTAYYTERALRDTVEQTLANCASFARRSS